MAAPTPVSALLHAACYVKAGVYLAARMHSFGAWPAAWGAMLMWIGTVTMAVGVMYAMVQTDLKRMLAFSTVSQIGYMMMGIGIGTPLAITAGLLHCLNHGFFKGGLFLTAGSVQHAAGTRDMNKLAAWPRRCRSTTLSWLIGVGSMMGIPLMSGFASKWMLYAAALQAGWAVPAMVAWAASLGTVFSAPRPPARVPRPTDRSTPKMRTNLRPRWCGAWDSWPPAASFSASRRSWPSTTSSIPILGALGMGAGVHVTWLGLSADAGSFSTTGGLVLALVSLVLGGVIYAVAYAAAPGRLSGAAHALAPAAASSPAASRSPTGPAHSRRLFRDLSGALALVFPLDRMSTAFTSAVWSGLQAVSRGLGARLLDGARTPLSWSSCLRARSLLAGALDCAWRTPAAASAAVMPLAPIPAPAHLLQSPCGCALLLLLSQLSARSTFRNGSRRCSSLYRSRLTVAGC